jgi:hypothetical protein
MLLFDTVKESVNAFVLADISTVPTFHPFEEPVPAVTVIDVAVEALSKTAVSCAKGKLFIFGAPPEEVAQPFAYQSFAPVKFQ